MTPGPCPDGGVRALPAQREVLPIARPDISRRGPVRPQPVDAVVAVRVLMPVRPHIDNARIVRNGEPAHGLYAIPVTCSLVGCVWPVSAHVPSCRCLTGFAQQT